MNPPLSQTLLGGRLLIIAAVEEELTEVRAALSARPNVEFASVGCGLIEAAINTALRFERMQLPSAAIFIGSAGSYDHSVPLLSPAAATGVVLADASVALGHGYFPRPMASQYQADAWLSAALRTIGGHELDSGVVASPAAITADRRLGTIMRHELGARFENLELFSVAAACAARSIPWGALSVITNHCHKNAHSEWNQNRLAASKMTAAIIAEWINRTTIQVQEKAVAEVEKN